MVGLGDLPIGVDGSAAMDVTADGRPSYEREILGHRLDHGGARRSAAAKCRTRTTPVSIASQSDPDARCAEVQIAIRGPARMQVERVG
jgi:hypothetical protein